MNCSIWNSFESRGPLPLVCGWRGTLPSVYESEGSHVFIVKRVHPLKPLKLVYQYTKTIVIDYKSIMLILTSHSY